MKSKFFIILLASCSLKAPDPQNIHLSTYEVYEKKIKLYGFFEPDKDKPSQEVVAQLTNQAGTTETFKAQILKGGHVLIIEDSDHFISFINATSEITIQFNDYFGYIKYPHTDWKENIKKNLPQTLLFDL